jgi:tetratricopeptide (TPR) repeat protein
MIAIFFFGVSCFAQNDPKFKSFKENIAKSDVAIENPKKGIDPKTWMDRGKLFRDAYGVNVDFLRFGMSTLEAKVVFKEPRKVTEDGEIETYEYAQIKLHFEPGGLKSWETTKTVTDKDELTEAVDAYKKATSLDAKGKNTKKINEAYAVIVGDLENKFFNEIALSKFKKAHETALHRIEVHQLMGVTDTAYYFYAGYAAMAQSEIDGLMWKKAIDNYEKAIALNFREPDKGQMYHLLFLSYINSGDSLKALNAAQRGFEKHPGEERLMYDLINYYLFRGEHQQALDYLAQAVAKDPQNAQLLFAQGRTLEELGEREKSLEAYKAAMAANPNFFDPYFNMAVVFYNNAIKIIEECNADTKMPMKQYEECIDKAYEEFKRAIPLMEKAHEINPNDIPTMDTLSTLYYRLNARNPNPEYEAKYKDMRHKLGKE